MSKPVARQVWSNIDVFGLLNGMGIWDEQYKNLKYVRKPFDTGLGMRNAIYANHDDIPGIDKQGIINALSNEFGLTPYNVESKTIFELTYDPVPTGVIHTQDISGYYRNPGETGWFPLTPQIWSDQHQTYKSSSAGFIVWQNERFNNVAGYKNFTYSNTVEVLEDLTDEVELKFIYYHKAVDEYNKEYLIQFTDMNNPSDSTDTRFTYRKPVTRPSLSGQVVIYTLDDIPEHIYSGYYYDADTTMAKDFLYAIRRKLDEKFKHKWKDIRDGTSIWDIHKHYGSGHIPSFWDAVAPFPLALSPAGTYITNNELYKGGVEEFSDSLYMVEIVEEEDNGRNHWYPRVYPGRFYLNGIPYYLFQEPETSYIDFVDGEGTLPTGLLRGAHCILMSSGYYDETFNSIDTLVSGKIYEDHSYPLGENGQNLTQNIYRHRPYIVSSQGYNVPLEETEYQINFETGTIYASGISASTCLVYETALEPSGSIIYQDINPMNDSNITFDKYFLYLSNEVI